MFLFVHPFNKLLLETFTELAEEFTGLLRNDVAIVPKLEPARLEPNHPIGIYRNVQIGVPDIGFKFSRFHHSPSLSGIKTVQFNALFPKYFSEFLVVFIEGYIIGI